MIEFESSPQILDKIATKPFLPQIKVMGIGGSGCKIISRLKFKKREFIRFVAVDTSRKELENCEIEEKLLLGNSITQGWGTGGDLKIGKKVAMEGEGGIRELLRDVDLLFLVCGLGKGMGAGASSVVARIAKEMNCITVGFFILPFRFEGEKRTNQAKIVLGKLEELVDSLMIVNNDFLLHNSQGPLSFQEGFGKIDEILEVSLKAMEYLLFTPGLISIDFADIKNVLSKKGEVKITMGKGKGEKAGEEAIKQALFSPLWGEISLREASSFLVGIRGGGKFSVNQLKKIALAIQEEAKNTTEVSIGVSIDDELSDEVTLILIASGIKIEQKGEVDEEKLYQEKLDLGTYGEDNLDIPTFLRKGNN